MCSSDLITGAAVLYNTADYGDRVALVVGHEDHGVTNRTLASCDQTVFPPMHGKRASLNAHAPFGTVENGRATCRATA